MVSKHVTLIFLIGFVVISDCSVISRWKRAENEQFPQGAGPKKPGRLDQSEEGEGGGGDAGAMSEDVVIQDYQPTGQNTTEQGMPPKYPLNVVSAEASAHDNEVSGCRDHTNASMICAKARYPCFCEEHETYMYSYCRRSCKYCNPETRTYHRYWRLRAISEFNPTWMIAEIEMYTQRGENTSLTLNDSSAYASSEYAGFPPKLAFDRSMFTDWMPSGWKSHNQMDDWIAYEFPIPVNVKSVRLATNPQYPKSTPNKIVVEASDYRDGPFTQKWKIRNPDYVTDRIYNFIECPVLWRRLDGEFETYCFRLYTKYKTWTEARKTCQEDGGELASITSNEELNFILQDVRLCGFVWIGLNDRRREGFYEWTDGKNATYTRWPKGLYYDEYQRHFEDCTAMDPDGNWFTFVCQNRHPFICRKTLTEPKPPLPEKAPASEESPIIFLAPNYTLPVAAHINPNAAAKEEGERESYAELLTDVAVQQMKEKGFKPPMALANMIKPPADMSQKLVQITAQAEQKLKQMHQQFEKQQEQEKQSLKAHYNKQKQVHKQINANNAPPQPGQTGQSQPPPQPPPNPNAGGFQQTVGQVPAQQPGQTQPAPPPQPPAQEPAEDEEEEPPKPQAPNPNVPNPSQPSIAHKNADKKPPPPIKGKNEKTIEVEKISTHPPHKKPSKSSHKTAQSLSQSLPIPPPPPPNEGDAPTVIVPPIGESGEEGSGYTEDEREGEAQREKEKQHEKVIRVIPLDNLQQDNSDASDQDVGPPHPDEAPDTPDELRSPNETDEADSAYPTYQQRSDSSHKRHKAGKVKGREGQMKMASKRHNPKGIKETPKKLVNKAKAKIERSKEENLFKKTGDDDDDDNESESEGASGSASDEVESRRIEPEFESLIRELI